MKIGFCCKRHHKNCFPSCASLTVLFPPWQSRTFSERLMDSVDIFQCDTSMKNDLKLLSFSENTLCESLMRPSRTCLHRIHGEDYTDWDACPSECCLLSLYTAHFCKLMHFILFIYLFFYSGTIYWTLMATWCKPLIFPPPKHLVVLKTLHFSQRKDLVANYFIYCLVVDVFLFMIRPKRTNVDVCRKKNTLVKLFVLLSYLFIFASFESIQSIEHCASTVHTIHVPNNTRYTDSTPYKNTSNIPEIVDERTITEDFKVYVILSKVQCAKYINN